MIGLVKGTSEGPSAVQGLLYTRSHFTMRSLREMGIPILQVRKLSPERHARDQQSAAQSDVPPGWGGSNPSPFHSIPSHSRGRNSPSQGGGPPPLGARELQFPRSQLLGAFPCPGSPPLPSGKGKVVPRGASS